MIETLTKELAELEIKSGKKAFMIKMFEAELLSTQQRMLEIHKELEKLSHPEPTPEPPQAA